MLLLIVHFCGLYMSNLIYFLCIICLRLHTLAICRPTVLYRTQVKKKKKKNSFARTHKQTNKSAKRHAKNVKEVRKQIMIKQFRAAYKTIMNWLQRFISQNKEYHLLCISLYIMPIKLHFIFRFTEWLIERASSKVPPGQMLEISVWFLFLYSSQHGSGDDTLV